MSDVHILLEGLFDQRPNPNPVTKFRITTNSYEEIDETGEQWSRVTRNRWKIYILTTDTKTWFSNITGRITDQTYNHISISFDEKLHELYSFDFAKNMIEKENKDSFDKNTDFILYYIEVTEESYNKMKAFVDRIYSNKSKFFYSKVTLAKGAFNRIIGREMFSLTPDEKNEFICSTFVSEVLKNGGVKVFEDGYIPSPGDFVGHKLLKFVYRGKLYKYLEKKEKEG